MLAVKSYIQAKDATAYDALDPDIVVVDLTHSNLQQRHIEIRFYKHDSLYTLRQRIHRQTGTPPIDQHLQVYDGDQVVAEIPADTSDEYVLGRFGILHHGMRVHCIDMNPYSGSSGGAYEDTSLVEKFTLSDEAYDAKEATLRAWAKEQKRQNPNFNLRQHAEAHRALVEAQRAHRLGLALPEGFFLDSAGNVVADEPDVVQETPGTNKGKDDEDSEYGQSSVAHATVGDRCQVKPGDRRGRVAYIGTIPEIASGYWIGVVLDEPLGQNDGTFGGKQYFSTLGPKYGCVARGKNVQVGDFPEKDLLLDSDESDEDEI
jgi:tubulin-folding cofactor B